MPYTRSLSRPSRSSSRYASASSRETPASWTDVSPARRTSSWAARIWRTKSAVVGRGFERDDQPHGAVDEDAGGFPLLVVEDLAVAGSLALLGDLGPLHRFRIGPAGVAVDPDQPDGPVRRDGVEGGGGREFAARPVALVPVLADHPRVARVGVDPGLHQAGDLLGRLHAAEVDLLLHRAEIGQVDVGVDQPRGGEGVRALDRPGVRSGEPRRPPRPYPRRRSRRGGPRSLQPRGFPGRPSRHGRASGRDRRGRRRASGGPARPVSPAACPARPPRRR